MTSSITPSKSLAEASPRFQNLITNRFQDPPIQSTPRNTFLDSIKQSNPDQIRRRLSQHRHPMTGISGPRSKSSSRPLISRDRNSTKLNPRILETWLNSIVADAEELQTPSSITSQNKKRQPLSNYGIDRSSLLISGLSSSDIDRVYQSLFVHSVGFYQLILDVLDHTNKKYSIVTGIWKVFAVLLEYCCQLEYDMIISTLSIEKKEELEHLENDYKIQLSLMEEHAKRLVENMNSVKDQLRSVQKDLQKEIEKREELEDEIMQRGSGHEEEVVMRLQFENKLNQMYAKQRDLATRLDQLNEVIQDQQKVIDLKAEQVGKEKKKANDLIQGKIEAEQNLKKVEERYSQLQAINKNLENRIDFMIKKIEDLSMAISKLQMELGGSQNEIAQKRITIDDQKFEIEICRMQIGKLESMITEYLDERKTYINRINELQETYSSEFQKNKHFEQEYINIKESEAVYKLGFEKYKTRAEELAATADRLEREREKLRVALDSSTIMESEMKTQVKTSQEKLEEMNKGRRIVEELNDHLKQRLNEKIEELKDSRRLLKEQKNEVENLRNTESELNAEISALNIKIKSIERQFETTKETLQEKINNLNDILTSEKKIRENWIYRYEEEQTAHSITTKNLINTEDKLNDSIMKCNSLAISLDERTSSVDRLTAKNREIFQELLNLRSVEEEYQRKNKTLNVLMGSIEKENKDRISDIFAEIEEMKNDHFREIDRRLMENEDVWHQARKNYEDILKVLDELEKSHEIIDAKQAEIQDCLSLIEIYKKTLERNWMVIEDLSADYQSHHVELVSLREQHEKLKLEHFELGKAHNDWLNKVPRHLKREKNPFGILEEKIRALERDLQQFISLRDQLVDAEVQFSFQPDSSDVLVQTEIEEKEKEKGTEKAIQSEVGIQVNFMEIHRGSLAVTADSGKENSFSAKFTVDEGAKYVSRGHVRQQSADSIYREDEMTPVNLRSMYKHPVLPEEEKFGERLPSLGKKITTSRPPTVPSMLSSEIKRHIKQANSRRKHESFL